MADRHDEASPEEGATTSVLAPRSPATAGGSGAEDELAGLKREEEEARRELLAQRKASLLQRQQAARSTSTATSPASATSSTSTTGSGQPQEEGKKEPTKEEQAVRAEAVENAVRFLNHPKVKASPLGKRLAFLEHKGLNDAEITLALKRANISSDEIKLAMDLANSSPTTGAGDPSASSPPLPPRGAVVHQQLPPTPPPPASSTWSWWGVRAVGALACFALGGAASLLAAKYFFSGHGGLGGSPSNDDKGGRPTATEAEKADRLKAELEAVRTSQEALAGQMREAFVGMKEALESQRQTSSPAGGVEAPNKAPKKTAHEDETIASLKTEIKTLRAMLLDARTAESADTRASTMTPKRSVFPQPSSLPSTGSNGAASVPISISAGSKPSAPKPYERKAAIKADTAPQPTPTTTSDTNEPNRGNVESEEALRSDNSTSAEAPEGGPLEADFVAAAE